MDISLALKLLEYRTALHKHDRWSRHQLETFQADRLQKLRYHALQHSPFYQSFHKGLASRPLTELPVLTKQQLMGAYDDLVTDNKVKLADLRSHISSGPADRLFQNRYHVCATSGTSGEPGVFLYDTTEWAWILASYSRANSWANIPSGLLHRLRLAMVGSTKNTHQSGAVIDSLESSWVQTLRLTATDPIPEICEQLTRWKPRLLITYSAIAAELAKEQLAGRLDISPQAVMCVAEKLTKNVRALIKQAWGHEPFENYASTETGCIAAECNSHTGLHLFEDLLVIENVDEDNRPVPPGSMGTKILVSVLFSRTVPLIRYELDDSITLAPDNCNCGLPFRQIAKIGGRIAETLHIARPDGSVAMLHPTHFEDIIGLTDVRSWQVFFEGDRMRILILAPVSKETYRQIEVNLQKLVQTKNIEHIPVTIEIVDDIKRTPSGKMILVLDLSG